MRGIIFSVNTSKEKATVKQPVSEATIREEFGVVGDAHASSGDRQVSLLAWESMQKQAFCPKIKSKGIRIFPGIYAENITTQGVDLSRVKLKDRLIINQDIILEVSKIGKECHAYCEIFKKIGSCIMPKEGIFARVTKGGKIKPNDKIEVEYDQSSGIDIK